MSFLKEIREKLGLSQSQLKDVLNLRLNRSYDRHTISRWENGRQPLPSEVSSELEALLHGEKRQTTIITFANQKGGVGKTTSALNVSVALSKMGYRVLLIDVDPQASATAALLGMQIVPLYRQGKTLAHALLKDVAMSNCIVKKGPIEGVEVEIPVDFCPSHIDLAEVDIRREPGTEGLLKEAISQVQDNYEFIILDSPPHLGFLTWMALASSNTVFVPVRTEPYDVMGVNLILDTITKVNRRSNPRLRLGGVIPTQFVQNQYVDVGIVEHLIRVMDNRAPVLEPVPSSTSFSNAAWASKIPVDVAPRSPSVRVYVRLAEAIAGRRNFLNASSVLSLDTDKRDTP
ncbi:AAA family ATPase [Neokomagataea thailandica]|uniref:Chromosome partitioning protein ParA/MinD/MRP/soj n=1 Tax=Neokomagataea tanensis NBRC 106556 TaxID=1223519 RepID=A0ABQ0QKR6_9PROT|nr:MULTISPECIES: AAA family ATPase [Neokomagataea]GBR48299.1 chromosome partitioning protein ParA/MinD/MRP/soj [Neokomagataea tanensis NBRC 106556]